MNLEYVGLHIKSKYTGSNLFFDFSKIMVLLEYAGRCDIYVRCIKKLLDMSIGVEVEMLSRPFSFLGDITFNPNLYSIDLAHSLFSEVSIYTSDLIRHNQL